MAPSLPAEFVQRSEEFDALVRLLLSQNRESPIAITAALRGAGGYGKTTLAAALCHDRRIRNTFKDGILWTTLGESASQPTLINEIAVLSRQISGERESFTGLNEATSHLVELLGDRDILMVIDDVWNLEDARPFLQGGPRCARLITTRNLDTLPVNAQAIKVDAMKPDEAVELLAAGFEDNSDLRMVTKELIALAERLGEWPLLLKLVNGYLRKSAEHEKRTLPDTVARAKRALDKRGLDYFDVRDSGQRNDAVAKTIGISLELLTDNERARYFELAIFPEDVDIPSATLEKLWGRTGGLEDFDTDDLCVRLNRLSLLLNFDASKRNVRLHDVIRHYLVEHNRDRLPLIHGQLLESHRPVSVSPAPPVTPWPDLPDGEPYLWDHLAFHLIEAGRGAELVATVTDWRYLAKKTLLRKSLSVENDLVQAAKYAPDDNPLRALRAAFANTGHLFNRCETRGDIQTTIFIRLQHLDELQNIVRDLQRNLTFARIVPKFDLPDLPLPALIRTLEGHSSILNDCAFSPDGKLIVSSSLDRTLKVWDVETGQLARTLVGHSDSVNGCAFSPDGKLIISASDDCTLKVWDAETGQLARTLVGHSDPVNGCAFSPDGRRIVSASVDHTLKVWDAETGQLARTLVGHSDSVSGCGVCLDGGRIVSASADHTLKVWDAETGQLTRTLVGHSDSVNDCAFSSDGGLIVSASADHTLKVWDAETGQLARTLVGHSDPVSGCAFSPDGRRIVSSSWDRTLSVWDPETGQMLSRFEGHSRRVGGCAFSPDGKLIVSASRDRMLRVWNAETCQTSYTIVGHSSWVRGCAFSSDGRLIVSASDDSTLKVWDAETGQILCTLLGHLKTVSDCAFSPDGRLIVSASDDSTLKVWDAETGQLAHTLVGHSSIVSGCAFSPDGRRIVSSSIDCTLKIWDAESGQTLRSLEGHSDFVRACAFSPDGRLIISASNDNTLKVWDASSGQLARTLVGHSDSVEGCAFSHDGQRIISASVDHTLKVWDAETGQLVRTLVGHSDSVRGCAFSHDARLIASASRDSALKVWDAETGQTLATFFAEGPMLCCAIYGEMIAAGGARGVYFLRLVR